MASQDADIEKEKRDVEMLLGMHTGKSRSCPLCTMANLDADRINSDKSSIIYLCIMARRDAALYAQ